MEMLKEFKTELAGASLANMVSKNVLETQSKLAPSRNMTSTLKLFHSLFVQKLILLTGQDLAKDAQLNMDLIGMLQTHAPRVKKELDLKQKWQLQLKNSNQLTPMSHGQLQMVNTQAATKTQSFPTWLNSFAQFTQDQKKLQHATDLIESQNRQNQSVSFVQILNQYLLIVYFLINCMDIQQKSFWAKSTESRIEIFLDNYLIRCPNQSVRESSQRLFLALFKKGNEQQKMTILSLLESRCDQLSWMGKTSHQFLQVVKNIMEISDIYPDFRRNIIIKIFQNLQIISSNIITNPNWQFYSFAANLIDFGNEQFKPYLLQANGCFNCAEFTELKVENFKFDSFVQIVKPFTNKLQYVFKRVYQVKELTINLKTNTRVKQLKVFYLDKNKEYVSFHNKAYMNKEQITISNIQLQGLLFQIEIFSVGSKKKSVCVFCDRKQDPSDQFFNYVCENCSRKPQLIDISGSFKVVGADQSILSQQLCRDYQKMQESISTIRNLHEKIQSKQKINLNFKVNEMAQTYQRVIKNLQLLHEKNPSSLKSKQDQKCFSCNYYQMINIISFLKEVIKKNNFAFNQQTISSFKKTLIDCLSMNKFEILKSSLLAALAVFIVYLGPSNYQAEFSNIKDNFLTDLLNQVLVTLKQRASVSQGSIQPELKQIRQFLINQGKSFSIQSKIKLFANYYLSWDYLGLVMNNSFSHTTQIERLKNEEYQQLSSLIDFDISMIFQLNFSSSVKAFLKIIPNHLLPPASLLIKDAQILEYVNNKIDDFDLSNIQDSIIQCPNAMIRLDLFSSLPMLVSKLPVKQSMKIMNFLYPYKNVWNLNIIKADEKFNSKLSELGPQEQISICLYGYSKCKQYSYMQKIHKILVPQRLKFIIRLEAPEDEVQANSYQYPYLPIKEVRSEDLQGDTIRSLYDWVYKQLVKMNQAMPMDIIIEKSIIDNMDYPIQLVYQNVVQKKSKKLLGNKQYQFFRVIYRIQGIFGQPRQRSIGNLRDRKLQTCISYASQFLNKFSDQFSNKIGLDLLIQLLGQIQPESDHQQKKLLLFEMLLTLSMNDAICKKVVQNQYGDAIINATIRLMSFQNTEDSKVTNFLLKLSSKVIDEANQQMVNLRKGSFEDYRKMSGGIEIQQGGISQSGRKIRLVLDKVKQLEKTYESTGNDLYKQIYKRLIKLLPFCSKDQYQSSIILFDYFEFSNWSTKPSSKLENLFIFLESLSQSYTTFKSICAEKGVTNEIINYLCNAIRQDGKIQLDEKKLSTNKQQTQTLLVLLNSLIRGDLNLQGKLYECKLVENIYDLSVLTSEKAASIGGSHFPQRCYKIISYFTDARIIDPRIVQYIKLRTQKKKEQILPSKNNKKEKFKTKFNSAFDKYTQNLPEEVQQKQPIACSTCQQGFKKKDVLGLYIFFTKNQIPPQANWWKDFKRSSSFTSSTFFTPIHFQCHLSAYVADQKIPRSEWDGALIRNMDVLCNGWIPFKGPKTTPEQMTKVERKYFERNKNGNYWNVINDLQSLLQKLSLQLDFAKQCKGSTSLHNFKYIPILIGFSCHMIEKNGGCDNIEQGINYLIANPPKKETGVIHFACYSMFCLSYQGYLKNRKEILKWILTHKAENSSEQKNFETLRSSFLFLKIVDEIYRLVHKPAEQLNQNSQYKQFKVLDMYISGNLTSLVKEFQMLNERFRSRYTKYSKLSEFQFE